MISNLISSLAPMDLIHRLTEPYVTTREKGTGLGLGIVKQIIEANEGRISIDNAVSGGTIVEILLPLYGETQ